MVFGLNSVYTTHQRLMALSPAEAKEPLSETLKKAGKKALGGGVAGAVAMFVNVGTLMWMRTCVTPAAASGWSHWADGVVRAWQDRQLPVPVRHVDHRGAQAPLR